MRIYRNCRLGPILPDHTPGTGELANRQSRLFGLAVVVGLDVEPTLGLLGHEVRANEGIEVAVEHAVDIADFEFRAVIFDHLVGLHHVRADLAAKGNVHFGFVELVGFRLPLLQFHVVEARAKHLHGQLAVFMLAAFGLAANHDAARDVRDAHGGLHFVDVLASFAAGTERVNLQVFGTNVDFDFVIDFGNHEDGGKGGVATRRLIERRNPYQTMNTGFASEQPISVFAGEFNGRRLDAG